jgi:hypothetical protein
VRRRGRDGFFGGGRRGREKRRGRGKEGMRKRRRRRQVVTKALVGEGCLAVLLPLLLLKQ